MLMMSLITGCSENKTTAREPVIPEGTVDTAAAEKEIFSSVSPDAVIRFSEKDISGIVDGLTVDGTVLTVSKAGVYELCGSCGDGQVIVDCAEGEEVTLILGGLSLSCRDSAVISSTKGAKLTLSVMDGTENILTDAKKRSDKKAPEAVVYGKGDVTINGGGTLSINASCKHAVESKGRLTVCETSLYVEAEKNALKGKKCVVLDKGASLKAVCGSDAVHVSGASKNDGYAYVNAAVDASVRGYGIISDGYVMTGENADVHLICGKDGIKADIAVSVTGGNIRVEQSEEGIEACKVSISDGNVYLCANDDGINISQVFDKDDENAIDKHDVNDECLLVISGGSTEINASGDGVDSNGNIIMDDGSLVIFGPTDDENGAIDYNGSFSMNGGTLIALGHVGQAHTPNAGTQSCLFAETEGFEGGRVEVRDNKGNTLIACDAPKFFNSVAASHPSFSDNEKAEIYVNGELAATVKTGEIR